MSGEELLKALSFVEERHIQEAETAVITAGKPWIRWCALAACLILVVGAASFGGTKLAEEISLDSAENSQMAVGNYGLPETARDENKTETQPAGISPEAVVPQEIPSVLLRIDAWQENGFLATVEEIVDTAVFPVGTQLTVKFKSDICICESNGETVTYSNRLPAETDFPVGSVVQVLFTAQDGTTILVEQIGWENAF